MTQFWASKKIVQEIDPSKMAFIENHEHFSDIFLLIQFHAGLIKYQNFSLLNIFRNYDFFKVDTFKFVIFSKLGFLKMFSKL